MQPHKSSLQLDFIIRCQADEVWESEKETSTETDSPTEKGRQRQTDDERR